MLYKLLQVSVECVFILSRWSSQSHLLVAEVSLVERDTRQLVALTDVEHRNEVASIQQLLHQVSAQETRPPDDGTPFITLHDKHNSVIHILQVIKQRDWSRAAPSLRS